MRGVTFGSFHSYEYFGLVREKMTIGAPEVKTEEIDIPGADGTLDLTEAFGEPKYGNHTLSFTFGKVGTTAEQLEHVSAIRDILHGRKMKIAIDEDGGLYYMGRITVGDWTRELVEKITITCDCEPWKYKESITTVTQAVSGSAVITLNNLRKTVIPTVTVDAEMSLAWNGHSASLSSGADQIIESLALYQGDTEITVTGTGNITFKYQEAGL